MEESQDARNANHPNLAQQASVNDFSDNENQYEEDPDLVTERFDNHDDFDGDENYIDISHNNPNEYDSNVHHGEFSNDDKDFMNDGGNYIDNNDMYIEGDENNMGFPGGNFGNDINAEVPDVMVLNVLCAQAKAPNDTEESIAEAEESWQAVREWLSSHDAETVRTAAEQRGESGMTALHFACRNRPPLDVVDVFLSIAADTVRWQDSSGALPVHYAGASFSDIAVIQALTESFPESKTVTDRRRRTPLHIALGREKHASPDVILLLSSTGAASYPDEIGMLPLHYACAFGASEEVLYVLTEAYPEALTARDSRERTPLHFALSNAGRRTIPAAVRLLLSLDKSIVNSINKGPLPLRVLAIYAQTIRKDDFNLEEKRESVHRCLEHLLQAKPKPTADFFTALQSLPDWLAESAVVMPVVQNLLNEKISQRFPAAVLLLDFEFLALIITFYSVSVVNSLDRRFSDTPDEDLQVPLKLIAPLYLGAGYFLLRELIQVISFISLKVFKLWLVDPSNYLNIAFTAVVLSLAVMMQQGSGDRDNFRVGAAVSVIILWVKLLAYLRNMLIDFAVFVRGVFFVVRRLSAFLISLGIILIAFAQMFNTIFRQSENCQSSLNQLYDDLFILETTRCSDNRLMPYCNFWDSFLSVYTMLLGEVSEDDFLESGVAVALFIIFMFLVVILLANVLIAIVTDSYKVIQDQKAAIVFWTNRLDFVAEMDAIANGPWVARYRKWHGSDDSNEVDEATFGKQLWKQIMELFQEDVEEGLLSVDFLAHFFLRVLACAIIPLWILVGFLTFGWLWPPQVREFIFTSNVYSHSSDTAREDELRKTQVANLQQEVSVLKEDLLQELAIDRTQVLQIKSQVAERKQEITNEMRQIKRLVTMLFERQSQFTS